MINLLMQRQHLVAPDSHTSEITAAGTALNRLIPTRGLLAELHIHQIRPTPQWQDCSSAIFVANDTAASKRSVWNRRRSAVVTEGKLMGESDPLKIEEFNNVADDYTKFVTFDVYTRHLHYTHNLLGEPPPPKPKKSASC